MTAGPMNTGGTLPSKDGKRLFVLGWQPRGELVRYDAKSQQFVSYLSGISAEGLGFSRDGEWVAYVTLPDGTLWRSQGGWTQPPPLTLSPQHAGAARWAPGGQHG